MLRDMNQTYPGGMRRMGLATNGVRGDLVPAAGDSSAAWMYGSLTLPADAAKEYAYWILSHNFPFGLPLDDYSAGTIAGLPDGTYTATLFLEEQGVRLAPDFTATVVVGGGGGDATLPALSGTIGITSLTDTGFIATCPPGTDNVGVTGYQHRLDGVAWLDIAGGGRSTTYTGLLAESLHQLDMRCKDAANNYSPALTRYVTLAAAGALPPPSTAMPEDTLKAPQDQILVVGGFAPKDPRQVKTLAFEFRRFAGSVINPVLTIVRERGAADLNAAAMVLGPASVVGSTVYQRVQAGVALCDYTVYCEVDTATGDHLVMAGRLPVRLVP